ncbi:DNA-binding transcriptional LysR family regulator [Branchiibius hedensis]|uniref:DNA-binding transcriptional regulator, LysR family n=1 Tax=Branchiibius hedensis TaxID=672460 RepID=A0A2Y8ZQ32_9MICO|nr:LysR family transcriptional regulator [Branchiibius hedensis]PWJ24679.1 DNA-binding transcriptional LysR family regulator [Branchiibius hedensis]SSA33496.1 DNA-binding transcriptional regulator, LysR family [Branchiibius hedensis]
MELHQLRYAVAVADTGSFTAAAEHLLVAQSGVSAQVRKLERELGLTLFERSTRHVRLTPVGERILTRAREALSAVDAVGETAAAARGLVIGELRVGTVTGLGWDPLFDAVAAIHQAHPGVDLRLVEGTSQDLFAQLRDGGLDLIVAAWAGRTPEDVSIRMVVEDPLVVVVAPGHPWARRARVQPRELRRTSLICLPPGTGARSALDSVAARDAVEFDVRWEVSTPSFVRRLAARGVGVGVVSATTATGWSEVAIVPLADPAARSSLGVAWRGTSPSPAVRALLAQLPDS